MKKKFSSLLMEYYSMSGHSLPKLKAALLFCLFSSGLIAQSNEGLLMATFGNAPGNDKDVITAYDLEESGQVTELNGKNLTYENLGAVYGITIDQAGDFYIAAGGVYDAGSNLNFRTRGSNEEATLIYKIEGASIEKGTSWEVKDLVLAGAFEKGNNTLPNPAMCGARRAGLGNITYNAQHDLLYTSNFSDGKIYRLDVDGKVLQSFDPNFDGAEFKEYYGYTPLGQRPWGLAVKYAAEEGTSGKMHLYYSRWSEDANNRLMDQVNEIWSVELDAQDGSFVPGTEMKVTDVPSFSSEGPFTLPVADIEMDKGGERMLLKLRAMKSYNSFVATHQEKGEAIELFFKDGKWQQETALPLNGDHVTYTSQKSNLKEEIGKSNIIDVGYELNDFEKNLIGDLSHGSNTKSIATALAKIEVYPNPTADEVQVNNVQINSEYLLLNTKGQILQQGIINDSNLNIDLSNMPNGTYWLSITYEEEVFNKKINKIGK